MADSCNYHQQTEQYKWQWHCGSKWKSYRAIDSQKIEYGYKSKSILHITLNGMKYQIDPFKYKQINVFTDGKRNIRRIPINYTDNTYYSSQNYKIKKKTHKTKQYTITQPHTSKNATEQKQKHQNVDKDIIDKVNYPYSHSVSISDLRAGDHIYCWRKLYLYQHHGIYIGNGEVIHFSGEIINAKDAKIVKTFVKQFSQDDTIKRVKYGVSKDYFKWARAGSCNQLKSDKTAVILQRAKSALGSFKGTYSLLGWNCETFCLWCTLGQRYENSNQATYGYVNATAAMGAATGGMIAGPIGAVIGGAVAYTGALMEKNHEKKINEEKKNKVQHEKKTVITHYKRHKTNKTYNRWDKQHKYCAQQGHLDSNQLNQLISMGFDKTMATAALEAYNNDLNAAIRCLLANSRKA